MIRLYGKRNFNLAKVLVTSIYGHEDMINYFSDFRTQDKSGGVHYYPKGSLCWFEANQYGDLLGSAYVIKQIPDMEMLELPRRERGFRRLLSQRNKSTSLKELLTKERFGTEIIGVVKPKLHKYKEGE